MKKQKFGIDIDDTLVKVFDEKIIENYNKKYSKNLRFEELKTHDFNGDKLLEKEFFDYYLNEKNHLNYSLHDGAKEILKLLKNKYDLYLITSRYREKEIDFTYKYIKKFFPKFFFKDIIFTCFENKNDKKCEIANKLSFDVVIDDAPHHIENYINNAKVKKIIIFSEPWNKDFFVDNKRVFRINSWKELKNIL